jgi:hypothetical protein
MSLIGNVIEFTKLSKELRRLVFYSEGENYWVHLEGLVKEILDSTDIPICYISSNKADPGLKLEHPRYRSFLIDEGFVRNWLFETIDTDVMVMTMPDLNQYQVKRSRNKVHYVYVQHSLVSFHMVYRAGAFDYFDSIFCAGPHHIEEIRAIEAKYNLPAKNLVEHGYSRLEAIISEAKLRPKKERSDDVPLHVLVAPSWGEQGTIESGIGERIIDHLVALSCQVTLRPHPQTIKLAWNKVNAILNKHDSNPLFSYEGNVAGQESLHESDVMIGDWSGAALDYAFGLNKPVLFIDVPRKVNNINYKEIDIEPFEVSIREKIGQVVGDEGITLETLQGLTLMEFNDSYFYRDADIVGAKELVAILASARR